MRFLKNVYLYRYCERENVWSCRELKNVLVSGDEESYNLSDTLNRDAQIVLRIMGDSDADVLPQDMISFSKSNKNTPPDVGTFVVTAVCNNKLGSRRIRHTKVLCK